MLLKEVNNDVDLATQDLQRRTLCEIPRSLDRLIYLASTRDYNTGLYYHDGLAAKFSQDVACEALATCHQEAFRELVRTSLKDLVGQLEEYIQATRTQILDFIAAWKKLEPYRVAVPVEADPLAAEFLFSNFKVALAILEGRLHSRQMAATA
jgi:hypothetical protein